jgi:hypothetical protein
MTLQEYVTWWREHKQQQEQQVKQQMQHQGQQEKQAGQQQKQQGKQQQEPQEMQQGQQLQQQEQQLHDKKDEDLDVLPATIGGSAPPPDGRALYLKDWHFVSEFPGYEVGSGYRLGCCWGVKGWNVSGSVEEVLEGSLTMS